MTLCRMRRQYEFDYNYGPSKRGRFGYPLRGGRGGRGGRGRGGWLSDGRGRGGWFEGNARGRGVWVSEGRDRGQDWYEPTSWFNESVDEQRYIPQWDRVEEVKTAQVEPVVSTAGGSFDDMAPIAVSPALLREFDVKFRDSIVTEILWNSGKVPVCTFCAQAHPGVKCGASSVAKHSAAIIEQVKKHLFAGKFSRLSDFLTALVVSEPCIRLLAFIDLFLIFLLSSCLASALFFMITCLCIFIRYHYTGYEGNRGGQGKNFSGQKCQIFMLSLTKKSPHGSFTLPYPA